MKHLKMLGLAAMAIAAVMAFGGASASATELYSGATTLKAGTTITGSLVGSGSGSTPRPRSTSGPLAHIGARADQSRSFCSGFFASDTTHAVYRYFIV